MKVASPTPMGRRPAHLSSRNWRRPGSSTRHRIPLRRGHCGRHVGERAAGGILLVLGALCGTLIPRLLGSPPYAGAASTDAVGALVLITTNRQSIYLAGTVQG